MLKAIVYLSDSTKNFTSQEVEQLAIDSANTNGALGVTGYLCFHKDSFFQYIEGDNDVVSDLMLRIEKDDRHVVRNIFEDPHLEERRFAKWRMRHLELSPDIGVRVEHVIQKHFFLIQSGAVSEKRWVPLIWKAVSSLADIQNRLVGKT